LLSSPIIPNESFDQKVVNLDEFSKRVTITSKMGPLKTRVPFPVSVQKMPAAISHYLKPEPDRQSQNPDVMHLAAEVTRGSMYVHEASHAVLSWLAETDARMLNQLGGKGDFLQNCRVIIVY
jgi:hypothetical protein